MTNKQYLKFAYNEMLETDVMLTTLCSLLPYFYAITKQKKMNILNNFEMYEVLNAGNILEKEGCDPNYLYWIV